MPQVTTLVGPGFSRLIVQLVMIACLRQLLGILNGILKPEYLPQTENAASEAEPATPAKAR